MSHKYIAVIKYSDKQWDGLEQSIATYLGSFLFNNDPIPPDPDGVLVSEDDTKVNPEDSEVVQCIKELIREQVRPMVQRDGGDVKYLSFNPEDGMVKLGMLGACASCPSSQNTLKEGIERLLKHWIPEVKCVEEEKNKELFRLEENVLFKDEEDVHRVINEFEAVRREEYNEIKKKRTPNRMTYEQLYEPDDGDDEEFA